MKRFVKASAILLTMLTIIASHAEASFLDIGITAKVNSVIDDNNILGGAVGVGDIINGMYTYESTTPDSGVGEFVGVYHHTMTPAGITLSVNGLTFRTDPNNVNFILSVVNEPIFDLYVVRSFNNIFDRGTSGDIVLQINDPTGTALSSDTLPLTAPNIANWRSEPGLLIRHDNFTIQADVISATTVPEPSTTLLLGIALAGVLGYGSWRKHTA